MTTVPEIKAAMAAALQARFPDVPVFATPPNTIKRSPSIVLFWGGPESTEIDHLGPGHQEWRPTVLARVLVTYQTDTPAEMARIDALLTPIVDLFGIDSEGLGAQHRLAGLGDVDRVLVTRVQPSLQTEYAGQKCYAADVTWSLQFTREPEVQP